MKTVLLALAAMTAFTPANPHSAPSAPLNEGLEPLGFLVGHCWRGEMGDGRIDTHCFESAYGGRHVRDRHEVTGGDRPYSGETLYSWDGAEGRIVFTYWNSQGGVSHGSVRATGDRLDFGDEAYTGSDGRRLSISTRWEKQGEDRYRAVSEAQGAPALDMNVLFVRTPTAVRVEEERAPDGSFTLIHETRIPAPPEDVWRAISTPEGWRQWAVPVARWVEGEPDLMETSYDPASRPGDGSTIRQSILLRIAGRLMAFRTVKAPDGFPDFDQFRNTVAVFELMPEDDGTTRVRLTGAGYPDNAVGRRLLGFFRDGNRISLERLHRLFVEGPIDWSRSTETPARH